MLGEGRTSGQIVELRGGLLLEFPFKMLTMILHLSRRVFLEEFFLRQLTFSMMTSYAEIRSEATNKRVLLSTSYRSRTFPSAILGRESREVEVNTVC